MTREEAINILVRLPLLRMTTRDTIDKVSDALNMAIESLEEERPHGEWKQEPKSLWDIAICSVCGETCIGFRSANFCPNCGARMTH